MSKVLVTGGAGFIGSHLVDALVERGDQVVVIDNLSTGRKENLNPKAAFIKADIRDYHFKEMFDVIYHLAAKARVQPSIENPVEWNDVNVNGTLRILEHARQCGAMVVFASSSSVYGGSDNKLKETQRTDPKSPYALQKLIGEEYVKLYSMLYGIDYRILRFFNVYGERQLTEGSYVTVIGKFLNQRKQGKPLTIWGDGEQRRDFTYVKDIVAGLIMDTPNGVFNLGRGQNCSVNDIAEWIGGETVPEPPRIEPRTTLADTRKIRSLGWSPTMDVEEWINAQNVG